MCYFTCLKGYMQTIIMMDSFMPCISCRKRTKFSARFTLKARALSFSHTWSKGVCRNFSVLICRSWIWDCISMLLRILFCLSFFCADVHSYNFFACPMPQWFPFLHMCQSPVERWVMVIWLMILGFRNSFYSYITESKKEKAGQQKFVL